MKQHVLGSSFLCLTSNLLMLIQVTWQNATNYTPLIAVFSTRLTQNHIWTVPETILTFFLTFYSRDKTTSNETNNSAHLTQFAARDPTSHNHSPPEFHINKPYPRVVSSPRKASMAVLRPLFTLMATPNSESIHGRRPSWKRMHVNQFMFVVELSSIRMLFWRQLIVCKRK